MMNRTCVSLFAMVFSLLLAAGCEESGSVASDRLETAILSVADASGDPSADGEADEESRVDFAREVLPILSNHCYLCHGPDQASEEAKAAGFRLDLRSEAVDFGMIVPGDPDASPVIDVLVTSKSSRRMPPLDSVKKQLTPQQVETLTRWIAEGAEYTDHWAFVKPAMPEIPAVPAGADSDWPTNAIDRFVLADLHANGLEPNEPADPNRLIRRVSLDLIGLPPTPEQARAFVNDPSPAAYERVVDELLASPRFGEHWARQWLDKARYADTQGFAEDRHREIWRFRDYVIDAYNRDVPFDQFTIEQIAGDLLPDPTIDRVNTTGEVWLGMTFACAQCHTHKYDPIFHDEYFAFYAFFNQTQDRDLRNDAPYIRAPTRQQKAELAELEAQISQAMASLSPERLEAIDARRSAERDRESEASIESLDALDALEVIEPAELTDAEQRYVELASRRRALLRDVPTTLVMKDLPAHKHRETYLFKGGSFLAPDKELGIIEPGVPEVLNPMPEGAPNNRLGLAQWLIHDDNPLTARVQANRIWEQLWGIGLVETTEDFGFQGSYPSNKDLLDYLAVTYQRDLKWSTKQFIKTIVMSSAYRQSAIHTAEKLEADPFNRLMARGPRMRLSAEQIRDQALAVGGILVTDRIGGPSVTPYLPDGNLAQSFSGSRMVESSGDDLYRRGVYTYWKRGSHYASFATFDAPSRDLCTAKRSRTNTPLQAFVTLNDTAFFEAAQMLGRRILAEGGPQLDDQIRRGMWLALQREPSDLELETLRDVYTQSLADYRENPDAATQTAVGPSPALPADMDPAEAAAMTMVGNVLLNLDELINKP